MAFGTSKLNDFPRRPDLNSRTNRAPRTFTTSSELSSDSGSALSTEARMYTVRPSPETASTRGQDVLSGLAIVYSPGGSTALPQCVSNGSVNLACDAFAAPAKIPVTSDKTAARTARFLNRTMIDLFPTVPVRGSVVQTDEQTGPRSCHQPVRRFSTPKQLGRKRLPPNMTASVT